MLKNYNDYISFAVIVVMVFLSLRLFIASMISHNRSYEFGKRFSMFLNYTDNEDE